MSVNLRMERIEKLLAELQYEVERGMMEHEIGETLAFSFLVPLSRAIPKGAVLCRFDCRPISGESALTFGFEAPRLRVVK